MLLGTSLKYQMIDVLVVVIAFVICRTDPLDWNLIKNTIVLEGVSC